MGMKTQPVLNVKKDTWSFREALSRTFLCLFSYISLEHSAAAQFPPKVSATETQASLLFSRHWLGALLPTSAEGMRDLRAKYVPSALHAFSDPLPTTREDAKANPRQDLILMVIATSNISPSIAEQIRAPGMICATGSTGIHKSSLGESEYTMQVKH